jgi:hypothetical protein
MKTDESYKDDIKIDPDSLDIEWINHPDKYMKWAEKAAKAEDNERLCKESLEVVDAQIDKEIRESHEKTTESQIKNIIALDPEHQTALRELNDARYKASLYSLVVKAMDHRKTALERLVQLVLSSYFAGPSEPRNIGQEIAKNKSNLKARDEARQKSGKKAETN